MLSNIFSTLTVVACMVVSVHAQQYNGNNQRRELQNTIRRSRASIFELQDEAEVSNILHFADKKQYVSTYGYREHDANSLFCTLHSRWMRSGIVRLA